MLRQRVQLDEAAVVEQCLHPLARGELAGGVLLLDSRRVGALRFRQPLLQLLDALAGRHRLAAAGGYNGGCAH